MNVRCPSPLPHPPVQAVQQVVSNLLIAQIELRSEDSFDIQSYTHNRKVEKIVVPLEGEIERLREEFLKVRAHSLPSKIDETERPFLII